MHLCILKPNSEKNDQIVTLLHRQFNGKFQTKGSVFIARRVRRKNRIIFNKDSRLKLYKFNSSE